MRALLRGHTQQVADMRFTPDGDGAGAGASDLLASFGVDGLLFVRRVTQDPDQITEVSGGGAGASSTRA